MECCRTGTYECSELAFTCGSCGHTIWVDKCLVDEIAQLHELGIKTIGCCCGHGYLDGYIQVMPEDVEKMKSLGYDQQEEDEHGGGKWCFWPKSELEAVKR